MFTARQVQIFNAVTRGLELPADSANPIRIVQTPGYIDSVIETHDLAVALLGAVGQSVAAVGEYRGLGSQRVTIDRRHAGLVFNEIAYFFQSGWQFDISAVHTPVNGFYQTRDERQIVFNGAYPHLREGILQFLDCPNDRAAIVKRVAARDAFALEDELSRRGLCAAVLRSPDEWHAHPQGRALANVPPVELECLAASEPIPLKPSICRPLEGLRVLDFTHVVAGPTVGKLLAEHGAEVIHCRYPYLDHILGFDIETAFGKKNTYFDLRHEDDRALALRLVRECDVFVQGFRWGSFAARGFGPDDLRLINPRLIYVDVNAYGFQGPWAERRGWEQLAQAATGLAQLHSFHLAQPALIPAYINDYGTGCLGALGVLAALQRRAREGGSWLVRVALAKTAMLAAQFAANDEPAAPIEESELERYLIDQDSPIGLLTRVAPAVQMEKTPAFVDHAGGFPGSSTMEIGWNSAPQTPHAVPHRPTEIFRQRRARWRGRQVL